MIPIRKFALKGAFSERRSLIANKIRLEFRIEEQRFEHEFYMVERMAYEVILGIDFLSRTRMSMKCDEKFSYQFEGEVERGKTIATLAVSEAELRLEEILSEKERMFDGRIGCVNHYSHKIQMITGAPFKRRTYPIPDKHKAAVGKYLRTLEKEGIVSKQATQYINPLVVVIKKNGNIRMCLDARELNKRTTNDHAQYHRR